ncbi:MAG: hypothetical protein J5803_02940 [Desulfovibrio sp.]|nr:hypothetical protein [Desulfovibrio sp.]
MRITLLFLPLFCVLMGTCWAKNIEFGTEEHTFILSIPDTYKEEPLPHGFEVTKQDSDAVLVASALNNEELPFQLLHQIIPSRLRMNSVKKRERMDDVFISGTRDGEPLFIRFFLINDCLLSFVAVGFERKEFDYIMQSLEEVTIEESE